jgi:N-acetylneuraminic acid mutarotase
LPIAYCFSQGTWTQKADFGGINRIGAAGFSIGNKGYIGTGKDTTNSNRNDFWEYDPITDIWTQKADFLGSSRYGAIGFSIGIKGYIGTGGSTGTVNDFFEWDQASNTWTQRANLPGNSRFRAVGFSIGTKGYIGAGVNGLPPPNIVLFNDFWEWNQATNAWTQKADFGGSKRWAAVGFSIGMKGYISTGEDGGFYDDFWEWDQATNAWTQKANFGGGNRASAVCFSIGSKGYIGTGYDASGENNDFWEWDQTLNVWTQKLNFSGSARLDAVGFSIGAKGYLGTGGSFSAYYKDFWEWDPNGMGISEEGLINSVSIFPNPSTGVFAIQSKTFIFSAIDIYNVNGENVFGSKENNTQEEINISSQPAGIYFVQVRTSEGDIRKKVILQ